MKAIYVEDTGGSRRVESVDFPLAVADSTTGVVRIEAASADSSPSSTGARAFIGLSEGELFVQPADASLPVLCNGTPLKTSQWLRDGDVLRLGKAQLTVRIDGDEARLLAEAWQAPQKTDPPAIAPTTFPGLDNAGTLVEPVAFEPLPVGTRPRARRSVRPREVFLWCLIAVLLGAAWFVFSARSVRIETEPADAQVELQGSFLRVELGNRFLLRPGDYTAIIEKDGYRGIEAPIRVTDERDQRLQFTLEKRPGVLRLMMIPETGAEGANVFIDGEDRGTARGAELELSPGPHRVLVRAERYKDFVADVEIVGAGTIQDLTVEMEPRWAAVAFTSEPAGAAVRVDGERVGQTPVTAELREGAHGYELQLPGYKTYRSELAVVAGEPQSAAVRLALADGTLLLRSVPSGARVSVDGVYRGETPLDMPLEPGDSHDIQVSRAGYEPQSHRARFESGREQQLIVELVPILGEVEIVSDPPDALLYVDGELRGPANQVHRLVVVPQDIEVRKEGHETFRTHMTPRQGFPQSIEVTLRGLDEARVENMPAVIKTAQGAELRLVQPSRFTMGASRREPGRRANETIREVELTRRYYLAIEEVSNRQFREFDPSHRSGSAGRQNLEIDHHPVVRVTWEAAARYCNWLSERESLPPAYVERDGKLVPRFPPSLGYRLPAEAEWTRAARYPDGGAGRKYPWGDSLPVEPSSGNYGDESAQGVLPTTLPGYNDSYPATAPTSSFLPNPLGILNLGGNVAEWIHDFYSIYPPGGTEPERDPLGPETGELHVIRGSSWMDGNITDLRLSYRDYGTDARPDVGFRIAKYAE